ncbi:glycosyltransferase, partial [candidate division KSB3 bacterium]|nr:glycosyltransferase [candidate division KSB3 bacterium]
SGAPLRTYSLLRRVAKEHEVWLVAFQETLEHASGLIHMQKFCQGIETAHLQELGALAHPITLFRYLLTGKPPDLRLLYSQALAEKIRCLSSKVDFDVVQIEHSHMALYLEALPRRMHSRTTLMLHDVVFNKYDRIYRLEPKLARKLRLWLHSRMMRWWEPRYAERFGRCITVSDSDRKLLLMTNPRLQVDVVPNGVDIKKYHMLPSASTKPVILFVGNMEYRPNVDAMIYFCQEVLPHIRREIADVEMWIVGINPQVGIKRLSGNGVHVTGRVDDVRPYYGKSTVCVVPLRAGGGTRLKILEAMALGRPVISTSIGCEGLDVIDGEHILIADSPGAFVEETVHLLKDAELRKCITAKARQLVVDRYDWDVITRKLMRIYTEMIE